MRVDVRAYAKLNLSLRVVAGRDDGFHDLLSEVQTIDLADRLRIELTDGGVVVRNDLPVDGIDLAERAAVALLERKRSERGVRIQIEKRIPVGAGLGGGSSDAAAVLSVLEGWIAPRLGCEALAELGAAIGSDVPLFLAGGRLVMSGRGERIRRLPKAPAKWFVLVVPPIHCATAEIYARWDRRVCSKVRTGGDGTMPSRGENDLLAPALDAHPELLAYHRAILRLGGEYGGMSGSGSTFFAAFAGEAEAVGAAAELRTAFPGSGVFVCRSTAAGHRRTESR